MNNMLDVITSDGNNYQIYFIKTFQLDSYPNKKYIAYTFGEEIDEMVKSYVSIINEENEQIRLEAITDKEEWNDVKEGLKELLLDNEISGDINYGS